MIAKMIHEVPNTFEDKINVLTWKKEIQEIYNSGESFPIVLT